MNDRMQYVMKPLGAGDPIRLGPYRVLGVLGVLGEGGLGKVHLGRDDSGRTAAVKVLLPELAHAPHLVQRLREAHTTQAVLDPRTEDTDDRPWIATEFLSGPPRRRRAPVRAVRRRRHGVRALAATLRDVHAAGLVHRDLKPANAVLTSAGLPRHRLRHRAPRTRADARHHRPGAGHPRVRRPGAGARPARRTGRGRLLPGAGCGAAGAGQPALEPPPDALWQADLERPGSAPLPVNGTGALAGRPPRICSRCAGAAASAWRVRAAEHITRALRRRRRRTVRWGRRRAGSRV
ncbi:hypothetical protein [Streptomyces sp. NRRL S-448]|uniref:hypothetical protein n=1 Tax=Streptomyces sp. NRRL S-448 TaxID=1463907 RepID=UPI00356205E2